MIQRIEPDRPLLMAICPRNFLSFHWGSPALELRNLNILIGPNGSGKSNLIEALALMRSSPVPPQSTGNSDMRSVLRRGGGAQEWIWKGKEGNAASVSLIIDNPNGNQTLSHFFSFRADKQGFRFQDEWIEEYEGVSEPHYYFRFQDGHPVVNTANGKERKLARETVNLELSILAQRRDPEIYPEITYLAETYEKFRIYREWAFGRNTIFREPQKADMRNDRLEEDFSNLGLFLSRLRKTPRVKRKILDGLKDLYDGITDFEPIVEGGSVQVFLYEGDYSIPATRLSDGTLRYLCLLAILCDPTPPPLICIEEPELGLHPDILPKLADLLVDASTRTQLIVTTHSDILVDAMTECPEVVVVCEKHDGQTQMKRLRKDELAVWLDKYRLGQLWTKGKLGGTRW
jgi:predicted ATPase